MYACMLTSKIVELPWIGIWTLTFKNFIIACILCRSWPLFYITFTTWCNIVMWWNLNSRNHPRVLFFIEMYIITYTIVAITWTTNHWTCIRIIVDVLKMNMFCSLLSIMNSSTNTGAYYMTSSIFHLQLRRASAGIKNTSCLKEQIIIFSNSQLLVIGRFLSLSISIFLFWCHWKHLLRHWEIFKRLFLFLNLSNNSPNHNCIFPMRDCWQKCIGQELVGLSCLLSNHRHSKDHSNLNHPIHLEWIQRVSLVVDHRFRCMSFQIHYFLHHNRLQKDLLPSNTHCTMLSLTCTACKSTIDISTIRSWPNSSTYL